jgi:hypothetical protein
MIKVVSIVTFAFCLSLSAFAGPAGPTPLQRDGENVLPLPPRNPKALGGKAFVRKLTKLNAPEREYAIYREVLRGNVPSFLRQMVPINISEDPNMDIVIWAIPDYLAIGSDEDFVRVPINLFTAARLAEDLGLSLPTPKIVDIIYNQAPVKLHPIAFGPTRAMDSPSYILAHNQAIQEQLQESYPHRLAAGHKKDIVFCNRMIRKPGSIAIYGWHKSAHDPIQPLSTAHDASYVDYSHGVRLISQVVQVNGKTKSLGWLLSEPRLYKYISNERLFVSTLKKATST